MTYNAKPTAKKFLPWLSLSLLLAAYSTFSWYVYHLTITWVVWVCVIGFAVLQALLLTTFAQGFKAMVGRWLSSDTGYFTTVLSLAFLATTVLVWAHVFGYIITVIAAEVLARLDLQNRGFSRAQSLFILTLVSLTGLVIGWVVSYSL
ncbi:hypothetical protein H6F93_18255 [Leptolyngbya sp. FACHB-671]|uniref:hypothetical protein n=1 Tax=Leptolyngbya sp. FACHB-671 TaxID=2692812 RepID=UPI001682C239|nr:hypothetical protein [Leptolyngbya sp. FACHB-671]MBD1868228.1 hypothetical protein [Cyanobacteria bacterium FACHB-471]MBD2069441.1 hypothetical protein [Leptolyngbya sp. FACHB-671]